MLLEIIIGGLIGTGIMGGIGLVFYKAKPKKSLETLAEEPEITQVEQTRTLEQKLHNALYECERNEEICKGELQNLFRKQVELLDGIITPAHIFVANKPMRFSAHNPVSGERRYYYERDLIPKIEESIREKTIALVMQYQQHINLLIDKIEVCRKLKSSHTENLKRLGAVKDQNEQISRIQRHQEHLQNSNNALERVEQDHIKSGLELVDIQQEVEFQEECLRQYLILNEKYALTSGEAVPEQLQQELKRLMDKANEQ